MRILALLFAAIGIAGAQTVTVPGSPAVSLTWTAPAVCTTATPCQFAIYRIPGTVTIAAGTTGATLAGTTGNNAVSFVDSTVTPGTFSYAVETIQAGANSVPSNTITLVVPTAPPAPVLNQGVARNQVKVTSPTQMAVSNTINTVQISAIAH
jgi:hypothetical protein